MKVYADFRQEVWIEPKDVIQKLIANEIGRDGWVFKEKNKYYKGYRESAGPREIERKELITKEKYEYVQHLRYVLIHLQKNK